MSEEKSGWRIFDILTSHKFELTFENIILDGKGKLRGIYLHGGGDFVIDGAMIQNCQTWEHNEFDYFGAAICISGANSVIIRNSGLIDNSSYSFGGAIGSIFTDNIVIENCRIIGNKAGSDSDGGAIYVSSGNSVNVVITESWIDNNSAKNSGGIHVHSVYDGEVSITDSTISNNKAASNGGGIGISSNISLEVDKTKISGNEAENGGGIYGKTGSEIIIKNDSIISSNEAINNGGGISIGELENLYIDEDVEFSNNKAGKEAGGIVWKCSCDCGNTVLVSGPNLTRGFTKNCGCYNLEKRDIKNQRFGKLIALYPDTTEENSSQKWICRCDCGNLCSVSISNLKNGHTQSCGCLQKIDHRTLIDGTCLEIIAWSIVKLN